MTKWGRAVTPDNVHAEYPRPQLTRDAWVNLNGQWDYAVRPGDEERPASYDGRILVPFPVESALSGVARRVAPDEALWYHRRFRVPADWRDGRVLLHFGAIDWSASVRVNGRAVGEHRGGYDAFTFDVTEALRPDGEQELVVRVSDPTDAGTQPRGKQVAETKGIWYTPTTGIWQTVWLEPVPSAHVEALHLAGNAERGSVRVAADVVNAPTGATWWADILDGATRVASARGAVGAPLVLTIPNAKPWSPRTPFLYDVRAGVTGGDTVGSYFGLRDIRLGKDEDGHVRILLNGEPRFQYGTLDQGFWPDGLYTAPSDEALRFDLEVTKRLGFNMVRKHVKVEPARWYYWCDRLGLLVWQDMPSGDRYIGGDDPDVERTPESARQFEREFGRVIDTLGNHPCVVMWVPFNEGWGQFDTARIVDWVRRRDPTRLVDAPSGWTDRGAGDVHDVHRYPGPGMPDLEPDRAAVLGEFGGLGLPVEGHLWQADRNWGYRAFEDREALTDAYLALVDQLRFLVARGLSAAVYTQTTDVETEVNGLMTYDRAIVKMDERRLAAAHDRLLGPPPRVRVVLPTSQERGHAWRWTTRSLVPGWQNAGFDDTDWNLGPGGFGTAGTPGAVVRTRWNGGDIWMRRTFDMGDPPPHVSHLMIHHDEDAEVFLNGRLVSKLSGYVTDYTFIPLPGPPALVAGRNVLAIHCRQTGGGQYIDAGLVEIIDH